MLFITLFFGSLAPGESRLNLPKRRREPNQARGCRVSSSGHFFFVLSRASRPARGATLQRAGSWDPWLAMAASPLAWVLKHWCSLEPIVGDAEWQVSCRAAPRVCREPVAAIRGATGHTVEPPQPPAPSNGGSRRFERGNQRIIKMI